MPEIKDLYRLEFAVNKLATCAFLPISAFGFCEYEDPEATLRCMRLLNEWEIADKKLVVGESFYINYHVSC